MKRSCLTVLCLNFSSVKIVLEGKIYMRQFWGFSVCMCNFCAFRSHELHHMFQNETTQTS